MPWRNDQFVKTPRKKHKSVITMELKDIWPEIAGSQKLGQSYHRNNRHRENPKSRFWQRKLYLHRGRTAN